MASSIKNEKVYTQLRKQGDSKEKAARIANASLHGVLPTSDARAANRALTTIGQCPN
jgi:hypothetical protein